MSNSQIQTQEKGFFSSVLDTLTSQTALRVVVGIAAGAAAVYAGTKAYEYFTSDDSSSDVLEGATEAVGELASSIASGAGEIASSVGEKAIDVALIE